MQDKVLAGEYLLPCLTNSRTSLSARGTITRDEERLGRYPGFYEYRRLAMEYWESHPTVSGMKNPQACIW
jgi:hypothetical protein